MLRDLRSRKPSRATVSRQPANQLEKVAAEDSNPDIGYGQPVQAAHRLRSMLEGSPSQAQLPPKEESDEAGLVARCRTGDEGAWSELVEHFSPYVYAIAAQGFRLSDADAEDVFQEVFARTYERLDQLRDDAAIRSWLAQLTRRLCLDRLREGARVIPTAEVELMAGDEDGEIFDRLDQAMSVREALASVSEECQEILDRFFARDQSYRMISEAIGIPQGTIASRISRCLSKLREDLTV